MQVRPETSALVAQLRSLSGSKLTRESDLGLLLDLAAQHRQEGLLGDLSFSAKFISRTYGIMRRIGPQGEGYDRLLTEFNEHVAKASDLARVLVSNGPLEVQQRFASTYFAVTPDALDNLLALFYDLSWYKNWLLDTHR